MATTANYIPIVGNFDPAKGFLFENAAGDPIPAASGPGFGPARKGIHTFGIVFIIGAGPVGDDASFSIRIPYPGGFTQAQADNNFNALLPVGSIFYSAPGSQAQGILLLGSVDFATQTFNLAVSFEAPAATTFVCSFGADFGFSITN